LSTWHECQHRRTNNHYKHLSSLMEEEPEVQNTIVMSPQIRTGRYVMAAGRDNPKS
jgi:hypothetical protein